MKLHIGGEQIKDGWKILNVQPKDGVDYVGNISNLDQFTDNSISEIYASHVIEHVKQKDTLETFRGLYRVLKPKGTLYISVPDMDILCRMFVDENANIDNKIHIMKMIFGGQVDDFDFHYMGWNQEFLFDFLKTVGFSEGKRVDTFNLFEDTSNYKPYGFSISLNVVAIK
jgi:predicted SAM-dependent methyltransferase